MENTPADPTGLISERCFADSITSTQTLQSLFDMSKNELWKKYKELKLDDDITATDLVTHYREFTKTDLRILIETKLWKKEKLATKSAKRALSTCAICYNNYQDAAGVPLACNHIFHSLCLEEMYFIHSDNKCPLCRAEFTLKLPKSKKRRRKLKKKIRQYLIQKLEGTISCYDIIKYCKFILPIKIDLLCDIATFIYDFCNVYHIKREYVVLNAHITKFGDDMVIEVDSPNCDCTHHLATPVYRF